MGVFLFIIVAVLAGLVGLTFTRQGKRHHEITEAWKSHETGFRRYIEERTGQRIRQTVELHASPSGKFQKDGRTLWLAFTADNAALVDKAALLTEEGRVRIYPKKELALTRFSSSLYELTGPEGTKYLVGVPRRKMEIVRHHIKRINTR